MTLLSKAKLLECANIATPKPTYCTSAALDCLPENRRGAEFQVMMHLAFSSLNAGWPADTLRWAEAIIETFPDWPDRARARRLAAVACGSLDRLDAADEHAALAAEQAATDKERAESLGLCAKYKLRRGNLEGADQAASEAEALCPGKTQVPGMTIAGVANARGRFHDAIEAYHKVQSIPVGNIPALNKRVIAAVNVELALIHCAGQVQRR